MSERVYFVRWVRPDGSHEDGWRSYGLSWMTALAKNVTGSTDGNFRKAEVREWLGPERSALLLVVDGGVEGAA